MAEFERHVFVCTNERLDDDVPSPAHFLSPRQRVIRRSAPPPGNDESEPTERKTLNHLFGIARHCGRRHEIQFEQRHHSNSRRSRMGTVRLCMQCMLCMPSGFVSGSLPESFRPPLQLDTPVSTRAATCRTVLARAPDQSGFHVARGSLQLIPSFIALPRSGTAARPEAWPSSCTTVGGQSLRSLSYARAVWPTARTAPANAASWTPVARRSRSAPSATGSSPSW